MSAIIITVLSLSCAAAAVPVSGTDAVFDLHIQNNDVTPDGFTRTAVTVNGQIDGPLISANKNDVFKLNVHDELTIGPPRMQKSTSIHWHGLFQHKTAANDGPAFVTQCPIAPASTFTYDFPLEGQSGTYWYHSHLGVQYCDGLRGPLVIYDQDDPHQDLYDVDDESTVITVSEWYHSESLTVFPGTQKNPPAASSHLINGKGRFPGGPASELSVVPVFENTRYRFRLVNIGCLPSYTFSIDNHRLTVIEVDGSSHQPLTVDRLSIFTGQRFSVVVKTDQPVDNYWIRIVPSAAPTGFNGGINSAILRYAGAAIADPTTTQTMGTLLNEADLVPLVNPGAPGGTGEADVKLNLIVGRNSDRDFTMNGVPFKPPSLPVLLQILSGSLTAQQLLPAGSVFELPVNKVIEVSIPGGGNHPFHLHGHTFDVVRSAGSTTRNLVNPPRRDVVNIGGGQDNVTIRFATDNPGPWLLHCHIDWHLDVGLAIVFAEAPEDNLRGDNAQVTSDQWNQLCPAYDALDPSDH